MGSSRDYHLLNNLWAGGGRSLVHLGSANRPHRRLSGPGKE
jgi:hypothetical protein